MTTAPRDETLVEVRHGPDQAVVLARGAGQNQAFIADADPLRRSLRRVTGWRPARAGAGGSVGDLVRPVVQLLEPAPAAVPAPLPAIVHAKRPRR